MTRIRNVQGKIIETTGGNDISYALESIVLNSHKVISIKGEEKGVSFNKPEDPPKRDEDIQKEGPWLILRSTKKKAEILKIQLLQQICCMAIILKMLME